MKRFLPLLLLLPVNILLNSQETMKRDFIRAVQEADSYYYYYFDGDYEKAAVLYEPLYYSRPDNCNLAAKLGICYLKIDGRKKEALELLKKASENVVQYEREYIDYGEKAPFDTYLYLGIAYHLNDSLEKAVTVFNEFKKKLTGTEYFTDEYVDLQIRDCLYAMEQKKKPMRIISDLFAPWLKEYPGACNPVLSINDSVFIFTQKKDGATQIYCSFKKGTWRRPVNITSQLGGFDRFYSNSITGDGRLLILYLDDGADGNLYYSERTDTVWSRIRSVGRPVNSIYWEAHGFITPDGNTIYFSSNRPGGEGELDIWYSDRANDGSWQEPVNCGKDINTRYDENTPFYDPETDALYFSSTGYMSMGNYDVFRSVKRNGRWTQPVGMPYAFNTVGENTFFILNNNAPGFVASRFNEDTGERNIYSLVAVNPADEISTAAGTITLQDGMNVEPKLASVRGVNLNTKNPLPDITVSESGSFRFDIKPGDYQIYVSHEGYLTDTININLPLYFQSRYIAVNSSLVPEKVFTDEFLSIQNVLFGFDSYAINDAAKSILEKVRSILTEYPELTVEIAGYTDSKGPKEYNMRLADRRAQAVIDYLTSSTIPSSRFIKKAFGASNFVAVNTNLDGSDNIEGRKYNRRVTFGIVDPQTGVVIRNETYTPEHLRQPYSMRYSIVLQKSVRNISPVNFRKLIKNDLLFVRPVKIDTVTMYVLGVFFNRAEAVKYLGYARQIGLKDAYIINQYDLENKSKTILEPDELRSSATQTMQRVYTIQLKATDEPVDIASQFRNLNGVSTRKAEDGTYKYIYGEYRSLSQAKTSLQKVRELGYREAFIREINIIEKK
jgi:outer membrane protein OmpA-like peptidoglycan-associated protein/tetratricopeptide (TPR) repeat protein